MSDSVSLLVEAFKTSERPVFFTGAGISTESGIPDFRSPKTGLWNRMKPIQYQDFVRSEETRKEAWSRKFSGQGSMSLAKPRTPSIGGIICARKMSRCDHSKCRQLASGIRTTRRANCRAARECDLRQVLRLRKTLSTGFTQARI